MKCGNVLVVRFVDRETRLIWCSAESVAALSCALPDVVAS